MWVALVAIAVAASYPIWSRGLVRRPAGIGSTSGDAPTHPESIPVDIPALEALEAKFRRVAEAVRPAVVAVMNPEEAKRLRGGRYAEGASGVIISPEGLVLTQWHVSHAALTPSGILDPCDKDGSHRPGEMTTIILHDGRACPAELMGAMPGHDLALVRLTGKGPYPFVPLKPDAVVGDGEWVLKLGHPWGHRRDRPAVVRSGRVVARVDDGFLADCPISGGDSGGPYFNLEGDLVGISHNGSADLLDLLPGNPDLAQRCGQPGFGPMTTLASPMIGRLLPRMLNRELPIPVMNVRDNFALTREIWMLHRERPVPGADWSQGPSVLAAFRPITTRSAAAVVTILNEGVPVALGTVVAPGGWILTKASELPPEPTCRLPRGTVGRPQVVGVDLAFDLALLRVPDTAELAPVAWSDAPTPGVGSFVAAVGAGGDPLAVGIVSVRDVISMTRSRRQAGCPCASARRGWSQPGRRVQ